MEKERIVEILLAMMFVVLIFIMIIIGINLGESKSADSSKTTTISNSYNKIYVNSNYETKPQKIYYKKVIYKKIPSKTIWAYPKERDSYYYDSFGKHLEKKEFGYFSDSYKVKLYNRGPGKYFTVRFYFEDYWEKRKSYDVRKYIFPGEEKTFYFRDVNKNEYKYSNWDYQVLN